MKKSHFSVILFCLCFLCCTRNQNQNGLDVINIDSAIDSLSPIKMSEIADEVNYIQLETVDSSLIGEAPRIKITEDRIIVNPRLKTGEFKVFDRKTGKFICNVGHTGGDPQAFDNDPMFWIDEFNRQIYFSNSSKKCYQIYDFDGLYKGKWSPEEDTLAMDVRNIFLLLSKNKIWIYNLMSTINSGRVICYDRKNDTMDYRLFANEDRNRVDDGSNMIYRTFGIDDPSVSYSNGTSSVIVNTNPSIYLHKNELKMKETFVDTIYSIDDSGIKKPYMYFNLGKRHWPINEWKMTTASKGRFNIDYIYETDNLIYFSCTEDLYEFFTGSKKTYVGYHNKENGVTKMMLREQRQIIGGYKIEIEDIGIEDDVTFSMFPVKIIGMSTDGNLFGLLTPSEILAFETADPSPELKKLQSMVKEDDNPIVVIAK